MRELVIFIIIFLIIFSFSLFIFNGRFIYAQIKYSVLGPEPVSQESENETLSWGLPSSDDLDNSLRLVIPAIGVDAAIVLTNTTDKYIIEKELEKGVVKYPDSNIILGHSSAYPWYRGNYGSVFSLLNKLQGGDRLFIYSGNRKYAYQVIGKEINLPKNLDFSEAKNESIIYLVSCWPVNTNWKRIVIKATAVDK